MKKSALLLVAILLAFTSCKVGSNSTTKGLENESFIEFVGTSSYKGGVDVSIDDKTSFKAKVYKEKYESNFERIKGEVYAISTGVHTITVLYNGNLIYQKQIYVSAQETKKIVLQ